MPKRESKEYRNSLTEFGQEVYDFREAYRLGSSHFPRVIGKTETSFLQKLNGTYSFTPDEIFFLKEEMKHLKEILSPVPEMISDSYFIIRRKKLTKRWEEINA